MSSSRFYTVLFIVLFSSSFILQMDLSLSADDSCYDNTAMRKHIPKLTGNGENIIDLPVTKIEDNVKSSSSINPSSPVKLENDFGKMAVSETLVDHDPIFIVGNDALATFISDEGLSGDGTSSSPYIIENFIINASTAHGIVIRLTDAYLIIRNCTIEGGSSNNNLGMFLYNVANVNINNNNANNNNVGISMDGSNNNTLTGNTANNNGGGILLQSSSNNNILSGNNANYNINSGIALSSSSNNNTLSGNNVSYNDEGGIALSSSNNTLSGNNASNNGQHGIYVTSLSTNNTIYFNNLYGNTVGQANDDGQNNTFSFNYWDDWTSPDINADGIVDNPYSIEGSANNQDPYPLVFPFQISMHDPIIIDGNNDFSNQAKTEEWLGNGSSSDPYIITEYYIANLSGSLIQIQNTDLYFKISDCILNGINRNFDGIYFENVSNGVLFNNTIYNCDIGLHLYARYSLVDTNEIYNNSWGIRILGGISNDNKISNNLIYNNSNFGIWIHAYNHTVQNNCIYNNSGTGIRVESSSNITIEANKLINNLGDGIWIGVSSNIIIRYNNIFQNWFGVHVHIGYDFNIVTNNVSYNQGGIRVTSLENSSILNNFVLANEGLGILIRENSSNISLTNNSIFQTSNPGLMISDSHNNKIVGNNISLNSEQGISLYSADNNSFSSNCISSNNNHGIYLGLSLNNTIKFNNFIENNLGNYQAFDKGSSNIIIFNYWDNWITPDDNGDLIVDSPYSIEGSANNQDPYPLTALVEFPIHLVSANVIYPNGGEILLGSNLIQWSVSGDSFDHKINYSVLHSTDNGFTWNLLVSNLIATNYSLDTLLLPDGSTNLIKVIAICSEGLSANDISNNVFIIDNYPPVIALEEITNDTILTSTSIVNLNITDISLSTVWFNWDGTANQTLTSPYNVVAPVDEGYHWLTLYANDSVGHLAVKKYRWWINQVPNISLVSHTNNTIQKDGSTIILNVEDDNLDKVWYNWDNGVNQSFITFWNVSFSLADGWHWLNVYANDTSGFLSINQFYFYCDADSPAILLMNPENNSIITSGTFINLNITDFSLVSSWYQWDNGNNQSLSDLWQVNPPPIEGIYWLTVYAEDSVGHLTVETYLFTINVAPEIIFDSPLNGSIITAGMNISCIFTDEIGGLHWIWYNWDNQPDVTIDNLAYLSLTEFTNFWLVPETEGWHYLTISVNDTYGLVNTVLVEVYVDVTAPVITLHNPENDTSIEDTSVIDLEITDYSLDNVWYNWDDGTNQSITSPYQIDVPTEEGYHWLTVYATDLVGHVTVQKYRWSINIPTTTTTTTTTSTTSSISTSVPVLTPGFELLTSLLITLTIIPVSRYTKRMQNRKERI